MERLTRSHRQTCVQVSACVRERWSLKSASVHRRPLLACSPVHSTACWKVARAQTDRARESISAFVHSARLLHARSLSTVLPGTLCGRSVSEAHAQHPRFPYQRPSLPSNDLLRDQKTCKKYSRHVTSGVSNTCGREGRGIIRSLGTTVQVRPGQRDGKADQDDPKARNPKRQADSARFLGKSPFSPLLSSGFLLEGDQQDEPATPDVVREVVR